jgi:hypothetical protein
LALQPNSGLGRLRETYLILLGLIFVIILGEEYKL